jgi:hypothetical protein
VQALSRGWSWAALALLVALSTALRAWAGHEVPVPWIAPDEMIYGLTGISLWDSGTLEILGGPTPYYSLLYPAFAGIPLNLGSLEFGYGALTIVQALVMSLAAVPVYLWGRSLVSQRWALAASALTLAVPGLAYSGLVMTEVLFYPLLTLAAWAMARALLEPTPRAQALLVLAALAATATRMQALVLLPAFVSALGVAAWLERSWRPVRRLWPSLAAMALLSVGWFAYRAVGDEALLGGYAGVTEASYGLLESAKYVVFHAASLLILTGVFPVCAVFLLLVNGLLKGESSAPARAYLSVAAPLAVWFVLQAGVFASEHVERLAERDLLALAPVLFLGLALWLDRGAPRSFAVASGVGLAAAAALFALPVGRLVSHDAAPDAFTLIPLLELLQNTSSRTLEAVYYTSAGLAVLAFVLLPRRALTAVPALLLAAGIAASVEVSTYVADRGRGAQVAFLGPDRHWIDRAADGPVAYVYSGEEWPGVWHSIFWNRKIQRVYYLDEKVEGPLPQTRLVAGNPPLRPPYAVASMSVSIFGEPVAQLDTPGLRTTMRLWRIEPPLRVLGRTVGVLPNGDINGGERAKLTGYSCERGGIFFVTLLIKAVPVEIRLLRDGEPYRTLNLETAPSDGVWRGQIPALPSPDGTCTLEIVPTGLTGSTQLKFQPA